MSERHRHIESPMVPINPRYVSHWFGAVSVADAINNAFERALERAIHYGNRHGGVTIIVPSRWQGCSTRMKSFLNERLSTLLRYAREAGQKYECDIYVDKGRRTNKYVEMRQTAFHLQSFERNVFDIPTHWKDLEKDYTWTEVCENGEYYSTSSSETWPRPEYARRAELEKIRNARISHVDPFARYYAAANRRN